MALISTVFVSLLAAILAVVGIAGVGLIIVLVERAF